MSHYKCLDLIKWVLFSCLAYRLFSNTRFCYDTKYNFILLILIVSWILTYKIPLFSDRSETARLLLELNAPVGVTDDQGQKAITWMITKMAPVVCGQTFLYVMEQNKASAKNIYKENYLCLLSDWTFHSSCFDI